MNLNAEETHVMGFLVQVLPNFCKLGNRSCRVLMHVVDGKEIAKVVRKEVELSKTTHRAVIEFG